ncbi:hypothetical protein GW17_00049551 [Ensete ventricosum]|nr:hypothetical protein GW17_00049551 [Ensete ventricosum]
MIITTRIGQGQVNTVGNSPGVHRELTEGIGSLPGWRKGVRQKKTETHQKIIEVVEKLAWRLTMIGAMELQPNDEPRSSLSIGPGFKRCSGISSEFARRFVRRDREARWEHVGIYRKKTIGLTARMPEAAKLVGLKCRGLVFTKRRSVVDVVVPQEGGLGSGRRMHLGHVNPSGRGSIITPIILSPAPREEASPRFSESAGEGLSNLESSCGVIRTFAWSSIARLLVGLKSSRLSCNHWVSRGKPSVEVKSSLEGMVGNRRPPTRLRARLEMIDTKSPWARLRAHLEMPRTKSPWARLRARLEVLETESP